MKIYEEINEAHDCPHTIHHDPTNHLQGTIVRCAWHIIWAGDGSTSMSKAFQSIPKHSNSNIIKDNQSISKLIKAYQRLSRNMLKIAEECRMMLKNGGITKVSPS